MEQSNFPPNLTPPANNPNSASIRISKAWLIVVLVIAAGAVGYFVSQYINSQSENGGKAVNQVTEQEQPMNSNVNSNPETNPPVLDLPAVVFQPDTFSSQEKTELYNKLINPSIDYEKDTESSSERIMTTFVVEKMATPSAGYTYKISKFYNNNGWGGFLYGDANSGTIPIWVPSCMMECKFSESYKSKYPEVIAAYEKNQ